MDLTFRSAGPWGPGKGANLQAAEVAGGSIVAPSATVAAGARVTDSVVGDGAVVAGVVDRSVLWPGAVVDADEVVAGVIRAPGLSVSVADG